MLLLSVVMIVMVWIRAEKKLLQMMSTGDVTVFVKVDFVWRLHYCVSDKVATANGVQCPRFILIDMGGICIFN